MSTLDAVMAKNRLAEDVRNALRDAALMDVRNVLVSIQNDLVLAAVSVRPWHNLDDVAEALAWVADVVHVRIDYRVRVVEVARKISGQKETEDPQS